VSIENEYCKSCKEELGLNRLTGMPGDEWFEGFAKALLLTYPHEDKKQLMGRAMEILEGKANATVLAKHLTRTRTAPIVKP